MISIKSAKQLFKQEGFQKYFKNTSWLFIEKIFRITISLFVGVWIARYLGPKDYGSFQYAFSVVSLFSVLSALGLDVIAVRELIKRPDDSNLLLGTSFVLKTLGSVASFLLLILLVKLTSNEAEIDWMILIIASSFLFHGFNVIDYHFRSIVKSQFVVYANFFSLILTAIIKIGLILYEAPLVAFAGVIFVEALIIAAGYIYYYQTTNKENSLTQWRFSLIESKKLLSDSWPQIFSGVILMIQARIDQVMLKEFIGTEEVGFYSVALRLVEIFGFVPILLQNSLFPSLMNSKKASLLLYKNRLINFYRLNFLFFILIATPLFFMSDFFVIILFGQAFSPAIPILSIMVFRMFFANMGVARGAFLTIENQLKFYLLTMAIGTAVNVGMNYYLIPKYQSTGAVIATLISFTFTIFLVDLCYKKTRKNVVLMLKGVFTFYKLKVDMLKGQKA